MSSLINKTSIINSNYRNLLINIQNLFKQYRVNMIIYCMLMIN